MLPKVEDIGKNAVKGKVLEQVVEQDGRLDLLLMSILSSSEQLTITRSQLKHAIESGLAKVDGQQIRKAGHKVKRGEKISFSLNEFEQENQRVFEAWDTELEVVYEDQEIVVINKPAGLTVHPGSGNKNRTLVNALLPRLQAFKQVHSLSAPFRPGIVHRLDKDTSGLLVVAKSVDIHAKLAKQFVDKTIHRYYLALLQTTPRGKAIISGNDSGRVDLPIGRDRKNPKQMAVREDGKQAITNFQVIAAANYGILVEVNLETGRTHQIRVHFSHLGVPLIGDKTYGNPQVLPPVERAYADKFSRQALHAYKLEFLHPRTGKSLSFKVGLPKDFQILLENFGIKFDGV